MGLLSDYDMLCKYSLVAPETLIRLSRFSLVCRIVKKAPHNICSIMSHLSSFKSGWCSAVSSDVRWLQLAQILPSCVRSANDLVAHVAASPTVLRRVRAFARSPFANLIVPEVTR